MCSICIYTHICDVCICVSSHVVCMCVYVSACASSPTAFKRVSGGANVLDAGVSEGAAIVLEIIGASECVVAGWLVGCWDGWLAGRLVGWLVGWLAGGWVGWSVIYESEL